MRRTIYGRHSRAISTALFATLAALTIAAGCGFPDIGGGPGGGDENEDAGSEMGPTPESCNTGEFSVERTSAENMDPGLTELPNRMAFAQPLPLQGSDSFGVLLVLTDAESVSELENSNYLLFWLAAKGGQASGEFTSEEQEGQGSYVGAQLLDGPYQGKGAGTWAGTTVDGNWEAEEIAPGNEISGSVTARAQSSCAEALSSATYEVDFNATIVSADNRDYNNCRNVPSFGAFTDLRGGQIQNLEVGGTSWSTEDGGAATYFTDPESDGNPFFQLNAEPTNGDGTFGAVVDQPTFGENAVDRANVVLDSCAYDGGGQSSNGEAMGTVTIEENDSGNLEVGPTSGSFDIEIPVVPEQPDDCGDSITVSGTFGAGVCRLR